MSRFAEPQRPVFQQLNASIGFDWRLGPYDVEQSRAHARMLAAAGSSRTPTATSCSPGSTASRPSSRRARSRSSADDEDIHMAIERRLTELVGPVGGRLHTARSRNDQVATDVAMFTRAHALATLEQLAARCRARSSQLAERHVDWAMPGYTHLQRAQPVYLSHHLLAYFWMFRRDARRFEFVLGATDELPLGAGALAGRELRHRPRAAWRAELGFAGVAQNSIDAVSNRDFVLDFLAAAATCATHLSRLGAEIVLWSSEEFGFCEVSDAWASGSSIMPQKKNPDAAELLRAKAPRVAGHLVALHGVMHGLPLTYNKDMQEDKEHLFDAVDTLELCLAAAARDDRGDRLRPRADGRRRLRRVDRRDRHRRPARAPRDAVPRVARHRRRARARGARRGPHAVGAAARGAGRHSEALDEEYYDVLAQRSWLESKVSEGGTALARVREQLATRAPRSTASPAERRLAGPRLLRAPGARGRARPRRLRRSRTAARPA